jgi:hypothetical protein
MEPDSYRPASGYKPGSPRERAISAMLAFAVILIVVIAMIYQFVVSPQREDSRRPVTFNVTGDDPTKQAKTSQSRPKAPRVATRAPKQASVPPRPPITVQKRIEKPDTLDGIPGFISMSKSDLASSDIGKMKGPSSGSDSNGKGRDARTAYGPGEGPGGVMLYDADWYRKPTDAELAGYMPKNGGIEGWGLVACRTIEHNHVEDCEILGESPRGSGFGRAVQNAAWQFLVKPPRINDKAQVGAWVRIRIDYHVYRVEG